MLCNTLCRLWGGAEAKRRGGGRRCYETNAGMRLARNGSGEWRSEVSVRERRFCEHKREVAFGVRWHGRARE